MSWALVIDEEAEQIVYVLPTEQEAKDYAKKWTLNRLQEMIKDNNYDGEELKEVYNKFVDMDLYDMFHYDEFNEFLSVDHMQITEVSEVNL